MLHLWPHLSFAELPRNRWQIPNGWGSKMRFAIFLFIAEKWWHSLKIVLPLRVTIAYSKYCTMLSSSVVSDSLWPIDCNPPGSSVYGDSLGKNTGVGCHALLQGIFPIQGSNPGLPPTLQASLYNLSHQGNPRILEWVAYPFSRGSSRPRNWTRVSCIADGFFTSWATRKAQ